MADRLLADQSLKPGQELVSANGWFWMQIGVDGSFGTGRVQTRQSVWAPQTPPHQDARLDMQGDGNLVAYAANNSPYWSSGTDGNPGAFAVLGDDGDLGIFTSTNKRIWHSDTAQDLTSPTIRYRGAQNVTFNETSENWKALCSQLPCSLALQWPGYSTKIVEDVIGGSPVVIQLWKGWCPKFLGMFTPVFPGGVGAEVGIYRRIPGKLRPKALPFLPRPLEALVLDSLASVVDEDLWWPFPELGAQVEFTLTNPLNDKAFFSAGPQTSYWLAKWMDDSSYRAYAERLGAPSSILSPWYIDSLLLPASPDGFQLDYQINGRSYPTWSDPSWAPSLSSADLLLALC